MNFLNAVGFSFLTFETCARLNFVSIRLTIFRALIVLAVCGLIAAPVARSAIAMTMQASTSAITSGNNIGTDETAESMPCCPKKAPSGGHDCPLVSLCQAGANVSLTSEISLIVFSSTAYFLPLLNEQNFSGQAQGPPHRPPKS